MLKCWQEAAFVAVVFAALVFGISFLCPAKYQICGPDQYTHAKTCTQYHAGPFVSLWVAGQLDAHNGVVTAIATAVMAWFTVVLSKIGRRQHADNRISQQAHIFSKPEAHPVFDQAGNLVALRVWMTWENSGSTPAREVRSNFVATFVPSGHAYQFQAAGKGIDQPFVLGPRASVNSASIDISLVHVVATLGGQGQQFIDAVMKYRDSFEGTPIHVVECSYEILAAGQLTPGNLQIAINSYGENNRYYDEE